MATASRNSRTRAVRGDAQRNRERILQTSRMVLSRNPCATMAMIAEKAGIGRVTLYGHFPSRKDLVTEVFAVHMREAEQLVTSIDPQQSPPEQIAHLIRTAWPLMAEVDSLIAAAEAELGTEHVHGEHGRILEFVQGVIAAGIDDGSFRTTQSPTWLAQSFFALMHGTAAAGRARAGCDEIPEIPVSGQPWPGDSQRRGLELPAETVANNLAETFLAALGHAATQPGSTAP
ncbi:MAG: TetR/AcrR family transcriptional regulator [Rhodococcus sp.]|nr:TetR/AcrR family transcriptional regulator [Rhodococcus sp. (in: high G+C Gram-positive bacteria)]